ncbi:Uncharacterised protein [Chlamydia trachomatis]|nr:Uncharacterised protein [Chlamydia trachomatis]
MYFYLQGLAFARTERITKKREGINEKRKEGPVDKSALYKKEKALKYYFFVERVFFAVLTFVLGAAFFVGLTFALVAQVLFVQAFLATVFAARTGFLAAALAFLAAALLFFIKPIFSALMDSLRYTFAIFSNLIDSVRTLCAAALFPFSALSKFCWILSNKSVIFFAVSFSAMKKYPLVVVLNYFFQF